MVGKIRVHKRGYIRRGYRRKDGTWVDKAKVKPTSYLMEDRGKPGHGKKIITIKDKGSLGGPGFFSRDESYRRAVERRLVEKDGRRSVAGKLTALYVLQRRTNPRVAEKARSDMKWVNKEFSKKK